MFEYQQVVDTVNQYDNEEDQVHMDCKLEQRRLQDHKLYFVFDDQEERDLKIFLVVILNVKMVHLLDYIQQLSGVDDSLRH